MKKSIFGSCILLFAGFVLIFTSSCEMDEPATLPQLSTAPISDLTSISAVCGGSIISDGGSVITARGVCWSTNFTPTIIDNISSDGAGTGSFVSTLTGLTSGTYYYVRAYATNSAGTEYGNKFIFITPVTDIDGNLYNTVMIGNQVWMTQNLKTTKYNDTTRIPNVTDNTTWTTLSTAAYCWYKNNMSNNDYKYGAL